MKNKKFKLAVAGLALTSAMLASSVAFTVAWFNGSSHLSINNFNIEFKDQSLTISSDNEVFKSNLTQDDLLKVAKFVPVSSMHSGSWLSKNQDHPDFYNVYEAYYQLDNKESDAAKADHGFLSQALYLKSSMDSKVTIDAAETFLKANHEANARVVDTIKDKYPQFTEEEILENLDNIEKSLRISILVLNDTGSEELNDYAYYIVDPSKNETTKYAHLIDMDGDTYYDSVDGKEALVGDFEYDATKLVYDQAKQEDGELVGHSTCFNARTKKGIEHLNIEESVANGGLTIKEENSLSLQEAENEISIPLKAGISKKIYFSLYLEGWDLDNTSFNMYSYFNMNLAFKMQGNRNMK